MTECLKKSGRIATQCMDTQAQAQLFVELLNMYILFRDKGNTEVRGGEREEHGQVHTQTVIVFI